MSRIHLRSNTLVLWLSLSAALAAAGLGVGCSSSDSNGAGAAGESAGGAGAGKGGKSGAGAPSVGDAGENSEGGTDTGTGGSDVPGAGRGGATETGGGAPMSDAGEPGEGGAAGSGDAPDPAIARTQALIASLTPAARQCPACHQASYAGLGFWANITPDPTNGIGGDNWTDDKIKRAISQGLNADGNMLCSTMERYTFTDDQLDDFVIFLRSLPANSHKITSACPN